MFEGLCSGDRGSLARAITLVETSNKEKAVMARNLMNLVTRHCRDRCKQEGKDTLAFRVGLSGPPGAGKSTFIESLGARLTSSGHQLAVLAVDPSSATTGGSLLGDKTRMHELSRNKAAYIRPSPARGHLGGVARNTNEAVVLCEAAGYNIVLVETVGVGQSEFLVSDMVDMFCLILPPAGGDELQGLKRGIVEQSDLIIVNKADGALLPAARRTAYEYTSALKFMRPRSKIWRPKVKLCSSLTGDGLDVVWDHMDKFRSTVEGEIVERRAEQRRRWMWSYVTERLVWMVRNNEKVGREVGRLEGEVRGDQVDPGAAADRIINTFLQQSQETRK